MPCQPLQRAVLPRPGSRADDGRRRSGAGRPDNFRQQTLNSHLTLLSSAQAAELSCQRPVTRERLVIRPARGDLSHHRQVGDYPTIGVAGSEPAFPVHCANFPSGRPTYAYIFVSDPPQGDMRARNFLRNVERWPAPLHALWPGWPAERASLTCAVFPNGAPASRAAHAHALLPAQPQNRPGQPLPSHKPKHAATAVVPPTQASRAAVTNADVIVLVLMSLSVLSRSVGFAFALATHYHVGSNHFRSTTSAFSALA